MTTPEIIIPHNNKKAAAQIKVVGIMHFLGNIISGGLLGTILAGGYLFVVDDIQPETKRTIYNIINFNLSYYIYMIVSIVLIFVIIGIPMIIIGVIIWTIILIIGFIKHLGGDDYEYPLSIKMLK